MGFCCEIDNNEFINACADYSKLFGGGDIIKSFSTRIGSVETYPYGYADNEINTQTPGKTGFINGNINNKIKVKLIGYLRNNASQAQIRHYMRHEIAHAMSAAAQDIYSTRRKIGINDLGIPFFELTKIQNSEYQSVNGAIYKKMEANETDNVIYGGGFCEIMTDLFAEASCVVSNQGKQESGITIDSIFKEPQSKWNNENIITGYAKCWPLARLAIAAFSNFPNPNYQNIVEQGGSIFSTTTTDTGKTVRINDFIYGSMCDPLYIAEQYDKIVGKEGAYFELCKPIDAMVDRVAYQGQQPSTDEIKSIIKKLEQFALLNTLVKKEQGIYSNEYADGIIKYFNIVKGEVLKEYGIKEHEIISQNNVDEKNRPQFTDVSKKEKWYKKIISKIKGIFKKDKIKALSEGKNTNGVENDFFSSIRVDKSTLMPKTITHAKTQQKDNEHYL